MAFTNPSMRWTVGLNTSKFQKGIDKSKRGVKGLRDSIRNASKSINGTLQGLIAVAVFKHLASSAINTGSHISDLSEQLRINAEAFQVLSFTAQKAGVDQSSFERAVRNATLRTQKAVEGNKSYQEAFQKLGIELDKFAKLPTEKKLEKIARAYAKAGKSQEAFNAVATILGERAGPKMLEVLRRLNDEGLTELSAKAEEAGAVMDEKVIAAMDELADTLGILKTTVTVFSADFIYAIKQMGAGSYDEIEVILYKILAKFGWLGGRIVDALEGEFKIIWAFFRAGWDYQITTTRNLFTALALHLKKRMGQAMLAITVQAEQLPLIGDKFKGMTEKIASYLTDIASEEKANNRAREQSFGDYLNKALAGMGELKNRADSNHKFWMDQANAKQDALSQEATGWIEVNGARQKLETGILRINGQLVDQAAHVDTINGKVIEQADNVGVVNDRLAEQTLKEQQLKALQDAQASALQSQLKIKEDYRAKIAKIIAAEKVETAEVEKQKAAQLAIEASKTRVAGLTFKPGYNNVAQLDDEALQFAINQHRDGRAKGNIDQLLQEQTLRKTIRRLAKNLGETFAIDYSDRQYNMSPRSVRDILAASGYDPEDEAKKQTALLEKNNRLLERNLTPTLNY